MRFSLFETLLIGVMVALATWSAVGVRDPLAEHRDIETEPLARLYGPKTPSRSESVAAFRPRGKLTPPS